MVASRDGTGDRPYAGESGEFEMPSPFPGMDPYLERYWLDVHHRLITYASDLLQTRLPSGLRARVQERVFVETEEGRSRTLYPDVHVVELPSPGHSRKVEQGIAVGQPLVVHVEHEPLRQGFIQIIESGSGGRVVTLIEFLSPSNKISGDGQKLYLKKRAEAMEAGTNVVEIDLTRTGERILFVLPEHLPPSHRTTYQICVWRGARPDVCEVYRAPLEEPLPTILVPLRPDDRDIPLEIQPLIDLCYQNGAYQDLDYTADPSPPLSEAEAAWARELLRSKGLRG
jgi:uncharacterized protein DUF4058